MNKTRFLLNIAKLTLFDQTMDCSLKQDVYKYNHEISNSELHFFYLMLISFDKREVHFQVQTQINQTSLQQRFVQSFIQQKQIYLLIFAQIRFILLNLDTGLQYLQILQHTILACCTKQYNSTRHMQEVELFPRYMGHQLRPTLLATIVGKITQINHKRNSAILETDPQSKLNIEVLLGEQQSDNLKVGKIYEVRGVCRSGKQIEMRGFTCFGVDFDLSSYNQMLLLATKQFRSIFYS